ncbi:MAG: molybdopterin-dependent oxidoreductase [Pseudomonadota bacterium]
MKSMHRTVCDPNCHADPKCGITATVEDDRIIAVTAAEYPVDGFKNRICLMGRSRIEYQYHKDRLQTPLKRIGERGSEQWEAISWAEAIELFVQKHKSTIKNHGARAVAMSQISGAMGVLTRGTMFRYAALTGATVTGPGGIDYGLPKGLEYMFGLPASNYFVNGGHAMRDAVNSDLIILWGFNMAVTRSVDHAPIKAAGRQGTRLICIDPTNSETAALCHQWVSIRPGSDGALAWALALQIIEQKLFDEAFLTRYTDMPYLVDRGTGHYLRATEFDPINAEEPLVWCNSAQAPVAFESATDIALEVPTGSFKHGDNDIGITTVFSMIAEEAQKHSAEECEKTTGVPAEVIEQLARDYATAKPGSIRMGYGLDRWYYSDSTARIIAMLACLTGNIGIPGGGVSVSSGARSAPIHASTFYAPDGMSANMLSMMDIDSCVRRGDPYPIKMECIALGNPFNQTKPDRARVLAEYISQLDFICVIDHFMTDTAKWADLVLPACTVFERTDMIVDSFVQLQQKVVSPEGESKSDFEIFCLIGSAMGLGDYFDKTEEEYLSQILEASAHADPLAKDITWERLNLDKVIYPWGTEQPFVGFEDRAFPTPSGRIECYKPELEEYGSSLPIYREPIEASPKSPLFSKYPLVLLSAHSRYRIHSTFANMPLVQAKEPEPIVRISVPDARSRGVKDGTACRVFNDRGSVTLQCHVDSRMRQGTVLIGEGHWVSQFIEGDPYLLTHDHFNETAQNYAHYDVLVDIRAA